MKNSKYLNIHTLGPTGTNCELASQSWMDTNNVNGSIILHNSLEEGLQAMVEDKDRAVLLSCIVYPELHNLVFNNREEVELIGSFIFPTMPMLLAAKSDQYTPGIIASHPAPVALIPDDFTEIKYANSNVAAAKLCQNGEVDACITTEKGANSHGLRVIKNFGSIPMGFAIHGKAQFSGFIKSLGDVIREESVVY
jgi:prephenate dehydratase